MKKWNFNNLSLLAAFKAIYDEGSVVGAADSLGLTQSAVSKHLSQLRDWFKDPLFVRTASGMMPTPRADALQQQVERVLAEAEKLGRLRPEAPEDFKGTFRLVATDEILMWLLPPLADRMSTEAPNLRLTALPLTPDYAASQLETRYVNLLIAVNWTAPHHLKQKRLLSDRFTCVVHKSHRLAAGDATVEDYAKAKHVLVAPLGQEKGIVDHALSRYGLSRGILASVPSFTLMTPQLIGRDRVVTLPSLVAQGLLEDEDLTQFDPPVELEPISYFALWHPRYDSDPKLLWMKQQIENILRNRMSA